MAKKPKVLFICTENKARSQMAEAFLRKHAGDRFEVHSAGLEPAEIHPCTHRVMQEIDLPLTGHYAKPIGEFLNQMYFGILITVCAKAEEKCPTFPGLGERLYWPIKDPAAFEGDKDEQVARFREARDEIEKRILAWLEREEEVA